MTKEELLTDLERQAAEAEAYGSTAPVANLLRTVSVQIAAIDAPPAQPQTDRLLTVEEAAECLSVEPRWFYDNRHKLPFVKKLSAKQIRVSELGLKRWMESR